MATAGDHVELERGNAVARLVLNRPERRNALSRDLISEMLDALDAVATDETTRVLVIEGRGPVFSAGHDLAEMTETCDVAFYEELFSLCVRLMTRVHELPQPVIAQVHGVATAAGCQLVASCDLAIAAADARFATPGVNIGLFCTTPMVPVARSIGRKRALEMLFTGEMIDATTAAEWGLVNRVVAPERLRAEVDALAERIAGASAYVLALGKRAFYAQDQLPEAAAYEIAAPVMVTNAQADDAQEGMRAFLEEAGAPMAEPVAGSKVRRRFDALAPLRHPAYARLWTGAFVSNIGTWMETLALGIYVTKTTHQAAWTGTIAAAAFVPIAFFGPVGGALADRFPRKWLLMATTVVQTALATLLAVLFVIGNPSPLVLTVIVFANGICAGLGFPAFQAILPDLVPVEDLPGAIALSSAQYNLGRIVGPALAGIVIALGGYAAAEAVNAASFFAVIAVLFTLTLPKPSAHARDEKFFQSIVEGFRFVRRERGLRVNAAAMCVNTFLAAPFIALVPAMAVNVLHSGAAGTSVLIIAQGIGAVTMALLLGGLVLRFGPRRLLVFLMATLPPALALYACAPSLAASAIALLVVGALYLGALSTFSTIAQLRAPASIRGRVVSVNTMILGALYPLGAVLQGKIADNVGLRVTTFAAGAIMAAVLLGARIFRPGITAALDTPVDQRRRHGSR